ncbi:MAG TPA: tRNA (adenosine(37)-N6)-threonylcarbamoyltransferase complex dimerization subunit type 1 TsaB [Deltaproteobacteria bacterium]|nr:MAG: tRNA (adenosine(37)-N6)-threonylcarbamoyltransferase complex dimerization subunit type 1 TsaB [Deltaproteobacteria bacterium]RLB03728.1 MAG: tRNA (adenosine(37)-N6)-threonylcarbamoyltransferase complex dimerization subunit type 1 TsaB [Deltaproteobacteria bacterium]HDM79019.1 tRNA (adenosine(37)-N6)-threonylcarbamoyltransferase complex dimerization subunit type 1 TsaB [Deltaproteobacteria bacterium]
MRILALDTSTSVNSVCIIDEKGILVEHIVGGQGSHNKILLKNIDLCIKAAGVQFGDIHGIAIALGPGSFTGLRIGISTAKTLAWANQLPILGIPTLDALALNVPYGKYQVCPMLDAKKNEVYCRIYRLSDAYPEGITDNMVLPPAELAGMIDSPTIFLGNGWHQYESVLREKLGENALTLPAPFHDIRASNIATLALRRLKQNEKDDPESLKPIYVRPSDAELSLKEKKQSQQP